MIYVFVFFLICMAHLHYSPDSKGGNNKKHFIIFSSFLFFILLLLRHDYVGSDTQKYRQMYDYYHLYVRSDIFETISISTEAGFYYLIKLLKANEMPFEVLKLISASLYMIAVSFGIMKWSKMSWLSYLYFLCWGYFIFNTTMRHCFALSFFVFAVYFAFQNKIVKYFGLSMLGLLFHSSAITILPIWLIRKMQLDKRTIILFSLLFIIVVMFADYFLRLGVELTEKEYNNIGAGGYLTFTLHLLITYWGIKRLKYMEGSNRLFVIFNIISLVLFPLAMLNPALFRLLVYFSFFNIFLVPNIIATYSIETKQVIIPFVILFSVLNFVTTPSRTGVRVLPYVYYWENYLEINPNVPLDARV